MYLGMDTNFRVSRGSKRFSIKASIHKSTNVKAHIKGTSTSEIKHISITAIYNKGINQHTHHGGTGIRQNVVFLQLVRFQGSFLEKKL